MRPFPHDPAKDACRFPDAHSLRGGYAAKIVSDLSFHLAAQNREQAVSENRKIRSTLLRSLFARQIGDRLEFGCRALASESVRRRIRSFIGLTNPRDFGDVRLCPTSPSRNRPHSRYAPVERVPIPRSVQTAKPLPVLRVMVVPGVAAIASCSDVTRTRPLTIRGMSSDSTTKITEGITRRMTIDVSAFVRFCPGRPIPSMARPMRHAMFCAGSSIAACWKCTLWAGQRTRKSSARAVALTPVSARFSGFRRAPNRGPRIIPSVRRGSEWPKRTRKSSRSLIITTAAFVSNRRDPGWSRTEVPVRHATIAWLWLG
jgi:hypothetical protein